MYRLKVPLQYNWSVIREKAMVVPYFTLTPRNRIHVHFVDLLDMEGKSHGIWVRYNISPELMAHLCRAIQEYSAEWELLTQSQTFGMNFLLPTE